MAATVTQSALSTQMVQVMITATSPGNYDPTSDIVQFSFTPSTYPQTSPAVWYPGSWESFPGPEYWAQCLVGPGAGGVPLSLGLYQVWVQITDNPEVPVIQACYLQITP